jgi:predicted transcriptional regulator
MPSASVLLTAAVKYLEEDLLPGLTGYHRFKTRVTANVLNIVRRELELRDTQSVAERARLRALVGHDGETDALSRELSELIREGAIDLNDTDLRAHLRQSLADALAINNPKWLGR